VFTKLYSRPCYCRCENKEEPKEGKVRKEENKCKEEECGEYHVATNLPEQGNDGKCCGDYEGCSGYCCNFWVFEEQDGGYT